MDASTLAALAVALGESRAAAVRELLLDRERAAMANEDARSFLAQWLFTGSLLVPSGMRPMTWAAAYRQRHNDLLWARDAMLAALLAVRQGDDERAEGVLAAELGSSSEEAEEEEEEAEEDAPTAQTPRR